MGILGRLARRASSALGDMRWSAENGARRVSNALDDMRWSAETKMRAQPRSDFSAIIRQNLKLAMPDRAREIDAMPDEQLMRLAQQFDAAQAAQPQPLGSGTSLPYAPRSTPGNPYGPR